MQSDWPLAVRPLVTQPLGTSVRRLLDSAIEATGATATIAVETDQREAIVPLVLAGPPNMPIPGMNSSVVPGYRSTTPHSATISSSFA